MAQLMPQAEAPPRVAIIGGGVSGLTHARILSKLGFDCIIIEKGPRVGGQWALAYGGVTLQNTKEQYHIPDFPWPFEPHVHPTGAEILRYLTAAVDALKLTVRLDTEVVSVEPVARDEQGHVSGWRVATRTGNATTTELFDKIIIAVGHYCDGKLAAQIDGQAEFPGSVISERNQTASTFVKGQTVVVLGNGKSALDMACEAARSGCVVHHVFRTPRWALPRYIFGIHFVGPVFARMSSVMVPSWTDTKHPTTAPGEPGVGASPPRYMSFAQRKFWGLLQGVIAHIARSAASGKGPEARARIEITLPTSHSLVDDMRSAIALAPDDYYPLVAAGSIVPHVDKVARLTRGGSVVLDSGAEVANASVVVACFGNSSPSFPFLPADLRSVLEAEKDGVQLWRHIVHPDAHPNSLAFAGFNHGFMHIPTAAIGALWIGAVWRRELALPPAEVMAAGIVGIREYKRAHVAFEPSRNCAIATRFQQYNDVVLRELGVSPWRKYPIAETFAPYRAADYAGIVDEYMAARKRARDRAARAGGLAPVLLPLSEVWT